MHSAPIKAAKVNHRNTDNQQFSNIPISAVYKMAQGNESQKI